MNGKQAKRLRKIAMGLAVTLDGSGRKIDQNGYEIEEHREMSSSSLMSSTPAQDEPVIAYTVRNKRNTLRGIYRAIKKGVASGKIDP